ncbi:MAG: undecaprenyl-phosphate glucose phosphotransferase [Ignavibacteriae bacterium]|nr:undecaprenyl-phosphate glucose phosphotransferase [Ignavibacteriota bacterium]
MGKKQFKTELYIPLLTIFFDVAAIISSFIISYWIRFYSPFTKIFPVTSGIPGIEGYLYFIIATVPVWLIVFQSFKLYRINRVVFIMDEFFVIMKGVTTSIIFAIGIIFFFREFPYSRLVFLLIWFNAIVLITVSRYILLKFEKTLYNHEIGLKNVAVIGENEMADKIYDKFTKDKYAGMKVAGYFSEKFPADNKKIYLGNYDSLPAKIRELNLNKIIISLPAAAHDDLYKILRLCEGINVEFMLTPDFIEVMTSKLRVEEVNGIPFMKIKSLPMNIWNRMVKRIFDIIFSFVFLLLTSPLMLILTVLVKVTSKGPLFYSQERIGLDGKKFNILKFRSMKIDAESSGPQFVSVNDDRYTKIGKLLRKFSLDELPQFLNVLIGDMSIVGPRPEREFFINQMKDSIDKYLERHRVKCGITGWAQVNGLRGPQTPIQTRIDYDVYYIENWSLSFDLKIIFKTFKELFFSKTAM